eukprot:6693491-Alexandrium_andersonii.AAC.1
MDTHTHAEAEAAAQPHSDRKQQAHSGCRQAVIKPETGHRQRPSGTVIELRAGDRDEDRVRGKGRNGDSAWASDRDWSRGGGRGR